jgi:hypothetical protein
MLDDYKTEIVLIYHTCCFVEKLRSCVICYA